MKMRAYRPGDHGRILEARAALARARQLLRAAGAPRAEQAVARAMKSAEGALRHADHRRVRAM